MRIVTEDRADAPQALLLDRCAFTLIKTVCTGRTRQTNLVQASSVFLGTIVEIRALQHRQNRWTRPSQSLDYVL
jgi:hypothetical protein